MWVASDNVRFWDALNFCPPADVFICSSVVCVVVNNCPGPQTHTIELSNFSNTGSRAIILDIGCLFGWLIGGSCSCLCCCFLCVVSRVPFSTCPE